MNVHRRLAPLLAAFLSSVPAIYAEDQPEPIKQPPSSQYNAAISRLRAAPKRKYEFTQALLGDAILFVASDSGITLHSLPKDSAEYGSLLTITIEESPFQVLSTICRSHALPLIFDGGDWYVRPTNDKQQVARDYEPVRDHIASLAKGEFGPPVIGTGLASRHDEIVTDLLSILDLPPAHLSGDSTTAASVPKVTWKPNSDTLHIEATRLQHLWVQAYLSTYKKGWKVSKDSGQEVSANSR